MTVSVGTIVSWRSSLKGALPVAFEHAILLINILGRKISWNDQRPFPFFVVERMSVY